MRITVLCFSHVKEALGTDSLALDLPAGSRAREAEDRVRELAGAKLDGIPLRIARNRVLVEGDARLDEGDEIALLPPVQGG